MGGDDPFRRGKVPQTQLRGMLQQAGAEQRIAALGRQNRAMREQLSIGQSAIDFLRALTKAKGEARISSLVQDNPGPEDAFRIELDTASNEWVARYYKIEALTTPTFPQPDWTYRPWESGIYVGTIATGTAEPL